MSKPENPRIIHSVGGDITLRDLFAAFALTAMQGEMEPHETAEACYEYADAMLEERVK